MKKNLLLMRVFSLCVLLGLMTLTGYQTQGQTVGCNDTVHWGTPLSFEGDKCCWTVLEGPTDCFYSIYNQIDCNYDTLADHRFLSPWVAVPSFAATDSVVLIYATQVTCTAEYSVAITTDGVTYDTLRHRLVDEYQHDTIMLGAYAGQVIRIQLCHYGLNSTFDPYAGGCSNAADYHWQLLFSALQWRSLVYPVVSWWVPTKAFVGETTWLRASLADGSSTGLTYTWHSSLTGQTLTGDSVGLTYTAGGVDTLTLITTNAFGSDTLTQTVTVVDCGAVVTAHPWLVDFSTDFDCWRNLGNANWGYSVENNTLPFVYATGVNKHYILVSPAVQLPADSAGLRLYWRDKRYNISNQNYRVLVTTGERDSLSGYDTVYQSTLGTSWTQRSVSLAAYAGQTVHIAFDVQRNNASGSLYLSDVKLYNSLAPLGTLEAPSFAATGDTVQCTVHLTQGADSTLTYSWHSALLDSTIVTPDSAMTIVYPEAGSETLTVAVSNAYGTLELSKSYNVYTCSVVSTYPWEEDFSDANGSYNVCWAIDGYSHNSPNSSYVGHDEETDGVWFNNFMMGSTGSYMITPPLAIPAGETHMAFMVEFSNQMMEIRVSPTASTDTAQFTDLLLTEPNTTNIKRRWVNLGAYAGQTIRVAIVHPSGGTQYVNRVWVGVDTLPYIGNKVLVPAKIHSDSTALCTVALYHGATDGLHYTWTSAVGGIITTNALGDSAWVNYSAGFSSTEDTLTVVATNAFGADTVARPLHIIDCTPALTLPWKETFADGLVCWYKPEGSKFIDAIPNNNSSQEHLRHLYLNAKLDTAGSWIMSKEIHILDDTTLAPRLFWNVASSNSNYHHLYSVLVTTAVDYTDTANYTVLYTDSSTHVNFSNYDLRSVDLTPYAGQSIHVAIHNHPWHMAPSATGLYIDNVEIRSSQVPVVSLSAPSATNSHTPVTFTATLVEGSSTGLTYTWHSTLMDSTMVTTAPMLTMAYTLGGTDTMMVIASNAYGADTATVTVSVTDCTPIASLPWMEDFNSVAAVAYNAANGKVPNCWNRYWSGSNANYIPHVISSYPYNPIKNYVLTNNALMMVAGTDSGYDSIATVESPVFEVPLNGQLLSFYYMHESASSGILSVGYLHEGAFVGVADMEPQAAGRTDTVSLSALPAGVNRFALKWKKTGTWYGVIVDDLRVFARDTLPTVRIEAPTQIFVGDPTTFRSVLSNGLLDGLTYTWHSSLTGATWNGTHEWNVTYNVGGYDTVSVIATNNYGADTAWAVVYVDSHPLPLATLTAPTLVYVGDSVTLTATINDCSQNGLAFSWHSSMLDTISLNSSFITLNYTAGGTDTVTFIVSNAYGADTVEAYIYVVDCGGAMVPYVETFEGVTPITWNTTSQSSLPLCWQLAYNGTNANIHQPTVVSSYPFINNMPDNALLMMAGNTSGYATWVQAELPLFNAPLSSLVMSLDYRYESANAGTLTVGYVDDTLGFFPIKTLTPHAGSYTRDTVHFAGNVASYNGRIALRWIQPNTWYAVVIDNIEVFINNGILAPDMLTVENVTATCATLRWSDVDTATAYRVSLRGAMSIDTVVTDTTLTLCNLEDDADYSVRVVPMVGSDEGRPISTTFHTLMLCAPLANVNISTAGTISWQYDTVTGEEIPVGVVIEVIDQLSQAVVHIDTAYTSPYVPDGLSSGRTYAFAVRTLCPSGTDDTAYTVELYVAPTICAELASNTIPSNSRFMDNYWRKSYSQVIYPATLASNVDTLYGISLRVASITQYYSDAAVCYYDVYIGQTPDIPTSPISSDSLVQVAQNAYLYMPYYPTAFTGWVDIIFNTPIAIDPSENLVLTIVDRSYVSCIPVYGMHTDTASVHFVQAADHGNAYTNPATLNFNWETNNLIPDIHLLGGCAPTVCVAPVIAVTDVDTHSVSLAWQQLGAEDQWLVEYRSMTDNSWTAFGTVSNTSCTITGLHPSTGYTIRVAALCSDTLYSLPETVHTICSYMELPYTISFLADEYPCWTLGSSLYHNNWNGITLSEWNTNGYLISPEVNTPMADLRATVTSLRPVAESYESRFAVGVGNADGSNVTWIDTIGFLQQNTEQTDEVHFNHYTGSGHYIILKGVEGTCNIHQFTLEAFAGCVPVHDVTVDNIGEHSAQLTWVPEVTTNTWAVYLDDALVATTATPSYTLSGLNSNTQYTVAVREICGAGDTSTAVIRLFQTRCDAFALPYFEEFDQAPAIGNDHILTDCWIFHKDGRYASAYCIGDQWSYTCLMFDDDAYSDTHAVNYVCSPRLQVGYGGATVRFKGQTTFDGIFTVGIMPDPYDTTTFIPVRDITVSSGGMAWYSFSTDTIAGAPVGSTLSVAFRFVGDNGHGVIDSLFVEDIPVTTYDLAIGVNDTTMGSVSGAGTYVEGTTVTVTATPNPGYRFVMWSDSVTSATRQITLRDNDISLTAYFGPDTVWRTVTLTADAPGMGTVSGAGSYPDSSMVSISAVPNAGYRFVVWSDGDSAASRQIHLVSDTVLVAYFAVGEVGIRENTDGQSAIVLYPNPATTQVTVEAGDATVMAVVDMNGRIVEKIVVKDEKTVINLGGYCAGVYYVRFDTPQGSIVRKLIVNK